MTRPVSSPRQMALRQTIQRNVFRKPYAGRQKGLSSTTGRDPTPRKPSETPGIAAEPAHLIPATEKPESTITGATAGRNDPCPCGSGKKYKKCCGG